MRQTRFGQPMRVPSTSLRSTLLLEPTGGLNITQPASDLPLGQTPSSENWITRQGYLERRFMLTPRSDQTRVETRVSPLEVIPILGGMEVVDVLGAAYPLASYQTYPIWYSAGSWSAASYVSSYGLNDPPSNSSGSYWDMTQVYYDTRDENVAVLASNSYQSLYIWQSGTTVFSTLTQAPQASTVATLDNYLLAGNIRSGNNDFVQRIQWSDRGSIATWTGGLSGFIDLLDMRGGITRMAPQDNRVVVFSPFEFWGGRQLAYPNTFDFSPLDRTVGCPYPWTLANTRVGLIWLGKDSNLYALAKGDNTARRIGDAVQRKIQDEIDIPERAWATYNAITDQYELYYAYVGGGGRPQRAIYVDLTTGAALPQTFDSSIDLTRGWPGTLGTGSAGTTWAQAQTAGTTWAAIQGPWSAYNTSGGLNGALTTYVGTSAGSMLYFSESAASDLGITVSSRWRSGGLGGEEPFRSKTLTEVRVDYEADSASSLTIRASSNQGASFEPGQRVPLPTSSTESQTRADVYVNSRYPVMEIVTEIGRPKIARLWATMRIEGR